MPYVVKDRVKVTSTTTGTGTFTLGAAAAGFQSFAAVGVGSGWNIAAAQFSRSFSTAAQENVPTGVFFKTDGTKMYVVGKTNDSIYEYNLSTAWNVATASFLQSLLVSSDDLSPEGIFFKSDGTKMYFVGSSNDSVFEYNLSSAWNISTAALVQSFSVSAQALAPNSVFFKPDGLKMYVLSSNTSDAVYEYNLSSAWNISTASYLQSFSVATQDGTPEGLFFRPDGAKMYVAGSGNDAVYEYSLSSAWNVTTASFSQTLSVAATETTPTGIYIKPDGSAMYLSGSTGDAVYQYVLPVNQTYYCITNGTDWEVGVGTVNYDGSELSRDTILESSNSNAAVNWGAGSKDVFCTYPADATEGTVPTADNSSVGTDLYAWTNLKKQLDAGVINGVPYNNNNTAGVVSTFSLVYTNAPTGTYYWGGVLSQNGEIHFVPTASSSNIGQKINCFTGIVSTYSLAVANISYRGGVLAGNGDIHFVPYDRNGNPFVGQKVNASGVVSTYSIIGTATQSYTGGVLAPNGDVHFISGGAISGPARGQKISASGVVSTYSLVFTGPGYLGGVLAINGDIHFIPGSAPVGQKVAIDGTVSTYSLIFTGSNAYNGGVLAVNGDIHFVPWEASRGQKVSASGVVSTYSLVYTRGTAYAGGVLAPNGDIHFVPYDAAVGQKVSATGVVSTYSLVHTGFSRYIGGVLDQFGNIYFVRHQATIGQKISTNAPRPIGYALSPFFNKF